MIFKIKKTDFVKGDFVLPASKSYSIRAFMIAACGGFSKIVNPSQCDDALVAIRVAQSLGSKIIEHASFKQNSSRWTVQALESPPRLNQINVQESGTVLRFLLPLLSLNEGRSIVTGAGTLRGRPNLYLTKALRDLGVQIKGQGPKESIPIYKGAGCLKGGSIEMDGSLSSQFISAFLIACPLLAENTSLKITGKQVVSQTYITMTQQILKKSGIKIESRNSRLFFIKGQQKYKGLKNFVVPSDYGLAAFFLAAGALVPSRLILRGNLKDDLVQSDGQILKLLRQMGVRFVKKDECLKINGPFELKGGDFSLRDCPDLVPIMAVLALFANGRTRIYNIHHARAKESDRIGDLAHELVRVGAKLLIKPDELIVFPQKNYKNNCLLDPHHDHRLAMAFAILGLKIGVNVRDIECTSKSYPNFVKDLIRILPGRSPHS